VIGTPKRSAARKCTGPFKAGTYGHEQRTNSRRAKHRRFAMRCILLSLVCSIPAIGLFAQSANSTAARLAEDAIARGNALYAQGIGATAEAQRNYEAAHVLEPRNALIDLKIGLCVMDGPAPQASLSWFQQAALLDSGLAKVHYMLGCAYQLNAKWDEAMSEFTTHIGIIRRSPDADATYARSQKHLLECAYGKEAMAHRGNAFVTAVGSGINSATDEYSPLLLSQGGMLFTRSKRAMAEDGRHEAHEAVWASNWTAGGWSMPRALPAPVNGIGNAHAFSLGVHGKLLVQRISAQGIELVQYTPLRNGWDGPTALPTGEPGEMEDAFLTADGHWLYFSSARKGGMGGSDIYRCARDMETGSWKRAEDLGPAINSEYDEVGAFLSADGQTLYFASEGHAGMGGLDLFKSSLENGAWTTPENMGWPTNSPADDRDLVLTPDGASGYFSSDRAGGAGRSDIYRVDLVPGVPADATAMLASTGNGTPTTPREQRLRLIGFVKGLHMMDPVEAHIEMMDLADSSFTATFTSDAVTGEFMADVPAGRNYAMHVTASGFLPHSDRVESGPASGDLRMDVDLRTTDAGNSEVMRNILFDGNSCTLEPSSASDLEKLLEFLKREPSLRIEIDGHTDSDDGPMPNQELSEERAKAVLDWLVDHGIGPERLLAKGYGASCPVAPNDSRPHKALNRRTEIKVL
jgi:outer membrane protein OmpA-like peptidoglycan-associated protein